MKTERSVFKSIVQIPGLNIDVRNIDMNSPALTQLLDLTSIPPCDDNRPTNKYPVDGKDHFWCLQCLNSFSSSQKLKHHVIRKHHNWLKTCYEEEGRDINSSICTFI